MPFFSRKKLPFNNPSGPANATGNGLASRSTEQPQPVCTWSAHTPQSGPSPLPFPRHSHTLTPTAAGELFLFGGYVHHRASNDLYVFSTRNFSTTLLRTSGEAPAPRFAHGAALIGTTLLICGGKTSFGDLNLLSHDSLYLLNLVSREWTCVLANGPGPGCCHCPTITVVGSKLFVFGGKIGRKIVNDMWTLDLNCLNLQPLWESYEPAPGNEKPLPRFGHVSVTTGDRIIIFGGKGNEHYYNDTWSFDISTRKWTELQCTGSIPSPRARHAAVLVEDVVYVFGGYAWGKGYMGDLIALQLSTQRWFKLHNVGTSPHGRLDHAMASDGTHVFVVGGYSPDARSDEISHIHVFDTKDIKYPDPELNVVNPNVKTAHLARRSFADSPTQEPPQHRKSSSLEALGASRRQNATPSVSGRPASSQTSHERNPGPNGPPLEPTGVNSKKPRRVPEDVSESSTEYHVKFAAPRSSSEATRLQLERQLSASLAVQAERGQRIAQLTYELALKSSLLDRAEANATEAAKGAELELREYADRLLIQTSLVKQRDAELLDMQAKLDELVVSRDQQVEQYDMELTNVHAKLKVKESQLEAVRLQLADAEKGWSKSKADADILRAQTGSMNREEGQVAHRLMERIRAIESEMASKRWNEKSIEEMECRNEG